MFRIDDHVGIAIAGLTSDARVLRFAGHRILLPHKHSHIVPIQQLYAPTSNGITDVFQSPNSHQPTRRFRCREYVLLNDSPQLRLPSSNHSLSPCILNVEAQVNTQEYGRRPYGVGFLVIGEDQTGAHLYEFSPSGNSYEYYAMSIGARSQSAKTYLEKHYESFAEGPHILA